MAYTPEQNGRAERENRTLVEAARTMILAKGLPKKLWAEAINTAAYILNRASKEELKNKSPYEMWHGSRASISHLRVFGTKSICTHSQTEETKIGLESRQGHTRRLRR